MRNNGFYHVLSAHFICYFVTICFSCQAVAETPQDSVQTALTWEKISKFYDFDYGVDRQRPKRKSGQFWLPPKSSVYVKAYADQWLRLQSDTISDFDVSQSDGAGLFYPLVFYTDPKTGEKVSHTPFLQDSLVKLTNNAQQGISLKAFLGVGQFTANKHLWKSKSPAAQKKWRFSQFPQRGFKHFYHLPKETVSSISIEGPRLVSLSVSQIQNTFESVEQAQLSIVIDNEVEQRVPLYFKNKESHRYRRKGKNYLLSESIKRYVKIPEGIHQLTFKSNTELLFNIREQKDVDSKLTSDRADYFNQLLLEQARLDKLAWNLSEGNLNTYLNQGYKHNAHSKQARRFHDRYTVPRPIYPIDALHFQEVGVNPLSFHWRKNKNKKYTTGNDKIFKKSFFTFHAEHTLAFESYRDSRILKIDQLITDSKAIFDIELAGENYKFSFDPKKVVSHKLRKKYKTENVANLASVSQAEIIIPAGATSLRLKVYEGEPELHLSIRNAKRSEITETEFLDSLDTIEKTSWLELFSKRELFAGDDLLPLWMRYRAKLFPQNLSPQFNGGNFQPNRQSDMLSLLNDEGGDASGVDTVSLAKGLVAFSAKSDEAYTIASQYLKQYFNENDKAFALQSLDAFMLSNKSDSSVIASLIEQLYKEQHYKAALQFGLIANKWYGRNNVPQDFLIRAAIKTSWDDAFDHLLSDMAVDDQDAWQALYARAKEYDQSIDILSAAQKGVKNYCQIEGASVFNWRDLPVELENKSVVRHVYNPNLNRTYQRIYADAQEKLSFKVRGPLQLKLAINPIHTERNVNDRDSEINDWVGIAIDGKTYQRPIIANKIRSESQIVYDSPVYPGETENIYLTLDAGMHEISIWTEQESSLFSIQARGPDFFTAAYFSTFLQHSEKERVSLRHNIRSLPRHSVGLIQSRDGRLKNFCSVKTRRSIAGGLDVNVEDMPKSAMISEDSIGELAQILDSLHEPTNVEEELVSSLSLNQVQEHLIQIYAILAEKENQSHHSKRSQLLGLFNLLASRYPQDGFIKRLLSTVNQSYFWEVEQLVRGAAGIKVFDSTQWSIDTSHQWQRNKIFAKKPASEEIRIDTRQIHNLRVINNENNKKWIELALRLDKLGFVKLPSVDIQLFLNGQAYKTVNLSEEGNQKNLKIDFASGTHSIGLKLVNARRQHWVYASLHEIAASIQNQTPDSESDTSRQQESIIANSTRTYHVVDPKKPMKVYLETASWVRLESYDGEQWFYDLKYVPKQGDFTISTEDLRGKYVRVHSLKTNSQRERLALVNITPPLRELNRNSEAEENIRLSKQKTVVTFIDRLKTLKQGAGTDSFYLSYKERYDLDTSADEESNLDGEEDEDKEKFWELGWQYRKNMEDLDLHWRSDIFARQHKVGDFGVLGTKQSLDWRPKRRNWRVGLDFAAYQQEQAEQSVHAQLKFIGFMPLSSELSWHHRISLFSRFMPDHEDVRGLNDNDIYTRYRANHRYGLDWRESLYYRPWYASRLGLSTRVVTNADLNFTILDQVSTEISLDQALGPIRLKLAANHRWLWADDHRFLSREQTQLKANLQWHSWQSRGWRWSLSSSINYDLQQNRMTGIFSLHWDLSGAKRLYNFKSSDSVFHLLDLEDANNVVEKDILQFHEI